MNSKFDDREFRHAFVAANVKRGIAYQLRALRNAEEMNQTQFGELIGKPQSVICRLENPHYGKVTVQTLIEIANDLDIGLMVKFVTHDRVLREVERLSQEELAPLSYEKAKETKAKELADQRHDTTANSIRVLFRLAGEQIVKEPSATATIHRSVGTTGHNKIAEFNQSSPEVTYAGSTKL